MSGGLSKKDMHGTKKITETGDRGGALVGFYFIPDGTVNIDESNRKGAAPTLAGLHSGSKL